MDEQKERASMNRAFSPTEIEEIRRNISRSLTDTFQMMFQLDIFLLPDLLKNDESGMVTSFIELTNRKTRAHLTMAITKSVVEQIAKKLGGNGGGVDNVVQDIVCEITNIVGNHLRAFISDKWGLHFVLNLPKPGIPDIADKDQSIIDLHFRIREKGLLELDFSYASAVPQSAA